MPRSSSVARAATNSSQSIVQKTNKLMGLQKSDPAECHFEAMALAKSCLESTQLRSHGEYILALASKNAQDAGFKLGTVMEVATMQVEFGLTSDAVKTLEYVYREARKFQIGQFESLLEVANVAVKCGAEGIELAARPLNQALEIALGSKNLEKLIQVGQISMAHPLDSSHLTIVMRAAREAGKLAIHQAESPTRNEQLLKIAGLWRAIGADADGNFIESIAAETAAVPVS